MVLPVHRSTRGHRVTRYTFTPELGVDDVLAVLRVEHDAIEWPALDDDDLEEIETWEPITDDMVIEDDSGTDRHLTPDTTICRIHPGT